MSEGAGDVPPEAVQGFGRLTAALSAIGTVWIIGLMLLINADILGRAAFGMPIAGVPELVTLSIIGIVFLQLPHTARVGGLTRSDALLNYLDARAPRAGALLRSFWAVAGAMVFLLLLRAAFMRAERAWEDADFIGNPGLLTVPTWPLHGLIALGAGMLAAQFLIEAASRLRRAAP